MKCHQKDNDRGGGQIKKNKSLTFDARNSMRNTFDINHFPGQVPGMTKIFDHKQELKLEQMSIWRM